jgi:hypothetical protein
MKFWDGSVQRGWIVAKPILRQAVLCLYVRVIGISCVSAGVLGGIQDGPDFHWSEKPYR